MGILKRAKASAALSRRAEELLYEQTLDEYESGNIRRGLWAQALAESDGDESRAKGTYIRLRVRAMIDEGVIVDQISDELAGANQQPNPPSPKSAVEPSGVPENPEAKGLYWAAAILLAVLFIFGIMNAAKY